MSKYDSLWEYVRRSGKDTLTLTFDEAERVAGAPLNHSFLTYKKELADYGYRVGKISLKARTVSFRKLD